jgi:hypothetical protein
MNFEDNFESSFLDTNNWSLFSAVNLTNESSIDGSKSLIMNGSSFIQTKDFNSSDDLITFEFKIKLKSIKNPLPDDSANFYSGYAGELFHITFDEKDKIPSDNYWSTKFRMMTNNTYDKIRFVGNDTDLSNLSDTAKSSNGNYFVATNTSYKVKLTITKNRINIDLNDGQMKTSFESSRSSIKNIRLTNRAGVVTLIDDVKMTVGKENSYPLSSNVIKYLDTGLFKGYLNADKSGDGLVLYRHTQDQVIRYSYFTKGYSYQVGVTLDTYTNSRSVSLDYKVLDSDYASGWTTIFDVYINGVQQTVGTITTKKGENYTFTFNLPSNAPANNKVTVYFPSGVNLAIQDLRFDKNSVQYPVACGKNLLVFGDSISAGAECFSPAAIYTTAVAIKYNLNQINQAVGGTSFDKSKIAAGNYNGFVPNYIILSYGTNNFAGGSQPQSALDNLDAEVRANIAAIKAQFPAAKIIAITPIYRNDENNGNTFKLIDVINKLKAIYSAYPDITVIDAHSFVPTGVAYFSSSALLLHPNTIGHQEYSKNLLPWLVPIMGVEPMIDWKANANSIIKSGAKS